jgi:predicted XRE-type DNA-binding protein
MGDRFGDRTVACLEKEPLVKPRMYKSVWDALEDSAEQAANMRLRSELMVALRAQIDGWNTTQAGAAKRLHVTQPRLNDLLRGQIDKFSLDSLVSLAEQAGLEVRLKVRAAA